MKSNRKMDQESLQSIEQEDSDSQISDFKSHEQLFSNQHLFPVGEGTYGKVSIFSKDVAIKKTKDHNQFIAPYPTQSTFGIVHCLDKIKKGDYYYLKFPASTMDLGDFLQGKHQQNPSISADQVKHIIKSITCGLKYLHSKGYVHCDLKCDNILFFQPNIFKVADLGLCITKDTKIQRIVMKRTIAPPQAEFPTLVDHKSDVWALGCILYKLCLGKSLYKKDDFQNISQLSVKTDLNKIKGNAKLIENMFGKRFKAFFLRLMKINPEERPSIQEILEQQFLIRAQMDPIQWRQKMKHRRTNQALKIRAKKKSDTGICSVCFAKVARKGLRKHQKTHQTPKQKKQNEQQQEMKEKLEEKLVNSKETSYEISKRYLMGQGKQLFLKYFDNSLNLQDSVQSFLERFPSNVFDEKGLKYFINRFCN